MGSFRKYIIIVLMHIADIYLNWLDYKMVKVKE
jgi:hypothetical protein